ncbi:MAG: glucosaminidase domain-containing protein [Parabacteroides sp.]|nr:glucosaminidase domain-containing protein [Parabacteroides sp.]MBQ8530454.1 glucosaminidase domain-containing protein [Parabacteroides sp.]
MRLRIRITALLLSFIWIGISPAISQHKNSNYEKYIKKYSLIAVQHQKLYRIPASITLAQGILESGAGNSELARKSNNHFGIKCHDWKGASVRHDDDLRGECFRKYKNPEQSYEDHARFLTERPRYASLFKLKVTDYKGWAKGLQRCGYATDRAYANRLIKLIEDYDLYRYDVAKITKKTKRKITQVAKYTIYRTHDLLYVYSNGRDNLNDIAVSLGFRTKDLEKYNEIPEDFPLQKGDIIYLEKKKKKADKPYYEHIVQVGESMHSISQKYGIQIKSLYKLNKMDKDYTPEEGDVLKLR